MRKMINKSMRRLFAILLSALIMLSAVVPAVAAEDESSVPAESSQTVAEESKDEIKAEEPAAEEPKAEEPKAEEPKAEEPKAEEPKAEEPEAEEPKAEEPKAEEPKAEEPKVEEPKAEEPKAEEPKEEEPKDEEPKDEEPKAEEPKAEEPKAEEPKAEEPKAEEKTFADLTVEEQYAALQEMSDEEIEAALSQLSEDQIKALVIYAESVESREIPQTVVFTHAGPFMPAVTVPVTARRMLAKTGNTKSGEDEPLQLDKQFTDNGDDTYTITLESYTTGDVISHEISTPVDIVLVLDQSGSMAYGFDGNSASYANSRQKAMKDAVVNFIDNVHEKYDNLSDHRISIVTFGSDVEDEIAWKYVDDSGFSSLEAFVNSLPQSPSGATNVAAAMGRAQHLVTDEYNYTGNNNTRQKVVVVFTDGIPTTSTNFATGVATGAINAGKNIKDAGATVYTVGIFQGADPSELYGASGFNTNSNGSVGSYWQSSQFLIFGDIEDAEIPAGNRFLNYLSSNFRDAANIGLTARRRDYIIYRDYRFTINQNYVRTSSDYYLTADDADSLNNVFQSIAEQIATPAIDLGSETVVKDIISPQLQIPEGATVRFYTQPYNGNGNWGAKTEVTDGSIHLAEGSDSQIVNVTGFNYNDNCVTEEGRDGFYGKKLIIEIIVETDPNFLGGTIDTNGPESGIYPAGSDTPVGTFPPPTNPFKMKSIEPHDAERNIYLSTEEELEDSFFNLMYTIGENEVNFATLFNGVNNAGVDYEIRIIDTDDNNALKGTYKIPAGKSLGEDGTGWASIDGSAPILGSHHYTIDSVVSDRTCPPNDPRLDPNAPEYDPNAPQPQEKEGHVNLRVFKPIFTYEDKNVYYKGTQIDISTVDPVSVIWKYTQGQTELLDTAVTMHTNKPTLTYTYSGVTGTTVDQMTDYTVKIETIKNGDVDLLTTYPHDERFVRNCTVEGLTNEAAAEEAIYKIHVYTPTYAFDDMSKFYGEAITLPGTSDVTWKNNDGVEAPATMDNTKPSFSVDLTPAANAIQNGYVWATDDFNVKAVIKIDGADVTQALIDAEKITRTCTPGVDTGTLAPTTGVAFVVHVKTFKLTVTKNVVGDYADMTKEFTFKVTFTPNGDGAPTYEVDDFKLGNGASKPLEDIPLGTIKVEEIDVPEGYEVSFKLNGEEYAQATVSGGKAGKELTLNAEAALENTLTVKNELPNVPITGINDGMNSTLLLMIAVAGFAAMTVLSVAKRFSGRARLVRK